VRLVFGDGLIRSLFSCGVSTGLRSYEAVMPALVRDLETGLNKATAPLP
jgi:hypothetical protein